MTRAADTGFTIYAVGFRALARDLKAADKATGPALRRRLKTVAELVAADARSRASFSTRIPGSIRARSGLNQASIRAGGPSAPNAAPLENKGKGGTFRHPVFGHRQVWVNQQARPFLRPALQANTRAIVDGLAEAITDVVAGAHFH